MAIWPFLAISTPGGLGRGKSLVGWCSIATLGVARQVGLEPVVVVVVVVGVWASVDALGLVVLLFLVYEARCRRSSFPPSLR